MTKNNIFYSLLAVSSLLGIIIFYGAGLIGQPISFWFSHLLNTFNDFAVLINTLVFAFAVSQLFKPLSSFALWMTQTSIQHSIATYVTLIALAYSFFISDPVDVVERLSYKLLYLITPLLYVLYWFYCVRGKVMHVKRVLWVLVLPIIYLLYCLFRGAFEGNYPYAFLDVDQLSYTLVLANVFWLGMLNVFITFLYWAVSKYTVPLYV